MRRFALALMVRSILSSGIHGGACVLTWEVKVEEARDRDEVVVVGRRAQGQLWCGESAGVKITGVIK